MVTNIYRPPAAELQPARLAGAEFYLVSRSKFLVLYLATLGLYGLYWFYRHWRSYRNYHDASIWPLPRALFAVLFAFPLFRRIFERASGEKSNTASGAALHAAVYALFEIAGNSVEALSRFGFSELAITSMSFACMLIVAATLLRVQIRANRACGDAGGSSNSRFTGLNLLWILFGIGVWLLVIVGLLMIYGWLDPWRLGIYPGSAGG